MLDYFGALVAEDESFPLTEAALAIAQDAYPTFDVQGALAEIDALVLRLNRRVADAEREADEDDDSRILRKLQVLNQFFFRELGFSGNFNNYYDPDNSFLNAVLAKRRGIPISLAVLYLEMAQQLHLPVVGVSFPGHFLLRVTTSTGEVILDPTTGTSLSEPRLMEMLEPYLLNATAPIASALNTLLQPAMPREILARMLRNLKTIYLQTEQWERLLAVLERLVRVLPGTIEERRDRGFALARLDRVRPALDDLQSYLDERPDAEDATVVESQLAELRQRAKGAGLL